MSLQDALSDLQAKVGTEVHVGSWLQVTQEMINAFADATRDQQWIHTDPARAKAESPFGGTIAHGFLTLSLMPYLSQAVDPDNPEYPDIKMGINYGLNKVRFPAPVNVDVNIRTRTTLLEVEEVKGNGIQFVRRVTLEIEGQEKPGCVAETVTRLYF